MRVSWQSMMTWCSFGDCSGLEFLSKLMVVEYGSGLVVLCN